MIPIPILIQFGQEVELRDHLCVATVSTHGIIEALEAVLGPISVLRRVTKDEGARIGLKPLEQKHVREEGRVADSVLESFCSKQLPVHKVHLVAIDALLLHRLQPALVSTANLVLVPLVEDGCNFAEVSVDLGSRLGLLKGDQVTLVVSEDPGEDWIRAQVVEAS